MKTCLKFLFLSLFLWQCTGKKNYDDNSDFRKDFEDIKSQNELDAAFMKVIMTDDPSEILKTAAEDQKEEALEAAMDQIGETDGLVPGISDLPISVDDVTDKKKAKATEDPRGEIAEVKDSMIEEENLGPFYASDTTTGLKRCREAEEAAGSRVLAEYQAPFLLPPINSEACTIAEKSGQVKKIKSYQNKWGTVKKQKMQTRCPENMTGCCFDLTDGYITLSYATSFSGQISASCISKGGLWFQ